MFWIKKSKIVVDAFCKNPGAFQYYPIKPAVNFLPDWWKNLESKVDAFDPKFNIEYKASTIKRCDGFISLYKNGFMLPLWSDMQIQSNINNGWGCLFADGISTASSHTKKQFDSDVFSNLTQIKIESPWLFQEKTGCNFVWQSPWWNHLSRCDKFYVAPGSLEFKYQHTTNINIFINNLKDSFMISAGTPMAHIIPISDKKIEVKNHYLDEKEFDKKFLHANYTPKFIGSYKERKRILKNKKNKCPFGFGKE